jgi:hypothetical protein
MKAYLGCVAVTVAIIGLTLWSGGPRAQAPAPAHNMDEFAQSSLEPFAVVELFTSEGCYSCPPADEVLGSMTARARVEGRRVFPIAFHVDYWNYLGWEDPYSSAEFSRRQGDYARKFGSNRRYTPQMIVNGQTEFVGSSKPQARQAVEQALQTPATAGVSLSQGVAENQANAIVAVVTPQGAKAGDQLCVALVERGIIQDVPRGENAGRRLPHENVARAFETRTLQGDGAPIRVNLEAPAGLKRENASIIAYVQDGTMWKVLGAAALDLK